MASTEGNGGVAERRPEGSLGGDLIVPVLAIALTVYYLVSTDDLQWEARSVGVLVGWTLLVLCAVQIVRSVLRWSRRGLPGGFGGLFANDVRNRQRVGLLTLCALFVAALPWTGITFGLFLVMAGLMVVLGVRRPAEILGIAGATAATVFVLFILLLNSRLPRGPLDQLLVGLLTGRGS